MTAPERYLTAVRGRPDRRGVPFGRVPADEMNMMGLRPAPNPDGVQLSRGVRG